MPIAKAGLVTQTIFYIIAGINHFAHPRFYLNIMPHRYTHPEAIIRLSGIAEIFGGLALLVPFTRLIASVGVALMLIVFFDVHIDMLRHAERFPQLPQWTLWTRILVQFALIAWALYYACPNLPISAVRDSADVSHSPESEYH